MPDFGILNYGEGELERYAHDMAAFIASYDELGDNANSAYTVTAFDVATVDGKHVGTMSAGDDGIWTLAADNTDYVKPPTTESTDPDSDARSAAVALMHAAEANDCLLRDIWAGNGPPTLQAIFRGLSNTAAEYVAYLAYSDGANDWRAKAGLTSASATPDTIDDVIAGAAAMGLLADDTPEPELPAEVVRLRLAHDLADAIAQRTSGAHAATYLTGRINEPGITMDDNGVLMAWDYDPTDPSVHIIVTEADLAADDTPEPDPAPTL